MNNQRLPDRNRFMCAHGISPILPLRRVGKTPPRTAQCQLLPRRAKDLTVTCQQAQLRPPMKFAKPFPLRSSHGWLARARPTARNLIAPHLTRHNAEIQSFHGKF
jgi:hypothetical protein